MFATILFSCILVFFFLLFFSPKSNAKNKGKLIFPLAGPWKTNANAAKFLQGD